MDTGAHERAVDAFAAAFLLPPGATDEFRQLRRQHSLRTTLITLAVRRILSLFSTFHGRLGGSLPWNEGHRRGHHAG